MTVNEKIKTTENKIELSKGQYNLHTESTKISALTSGKS